MLSEQTCYWGPNANLEQRNQPSLYSLPCAARNKGSSVFLMQLLLGGVVSSHEWIITVFLHYKMVRATGLNHGYSGDYLTVFLTRYTLQAAIHSMWRERNERRHGDSTISTPARELGKLLDHPVRNRCSSIQRMGHERPKIRWRLISVVRHPVISFKSP